MPSTELSNTIIQVSQSELKKDVFLEPIGGSKPQLSEDSNFKRLNRKVDDSIGLLCPAQGFPQPTFRFIFKIIFAKQQGLLS